MRQDHPRGGSNPPQKLQARAPLKAPGRMQPPFARPWIVLISSPSVWTPGLGTLDRWPVEQHVHSPQFDVSHPKEFPVLATTSLR